MVMLDSDGNDHVGNDFSYFLSKSHADTSYTVSSFNSIGLLVQEKLKIDFQNGTVVILDF